MARQLVPTHDRVDAAISRKNRPLSALRRFRKSITKQAIETRRLKLATILSQAKPSDSSRVEHISGSSLGTKAFHLGQLLSVMKEDTNYMDPNIWGVDPLDNSELTEDEDSPGDNIDLAVNTNTGMEGKGQQMRNIQQKFDQDAPGDNADPAVVGTKGDGKLIRDIQRKIRKKVIGHANSNQTVFQSFNYADAVGDNQDARKENASRAEPKLTKWNDGGSHVGYSADGVPIVYSIPRLINGVLHDRVFDVLMTLGRSVKLELGGGADGSKRNAKRSYATRRGEIKGILKLVLLWHAIGHPNETPVISHDFLKTAAGFGKTTKAIADMKLLSYAVNAVLKAVDLPQYEALAKLRKLCMADHPYIKAMASIDPLMTEGRAIMFNRQTPSHTDDQDPLPSWATMITLGKFSTGGELFIPRLNLEIQYHPRDSVILRGRILPHEVRPWGPGQRISIAHFTHGSLWNSYGLSCP